MTQNTSINNPAPTAPAWTAATLQNPHAAPDKAQRVQSMFTAIAPSYDMNNRLHSLWLDQHWRKIAVKMAQVQPSDRIVDVACGTGDLTLKFAQAAACDNPANSTAHVLGIDFTYAMLPLAQVKMEKRGGRKSKMAPITFAQGDALALPLPNASVDIVSIAFGIRNVADWGRAIDEFVRVLRPGGRLIILEFSLPQNAFLRGLYNFYFRRILPRTATWVSGDKTGAYRYLPESVNTFITRQAMLERMTQAGLRQTLARSLTGGICVCYRGVKP